MIRHNGNCNRSSVSLSLLRDIYRKVFIEQIRWFIFRSYERRWRLLQEVRRALLLVRRLKCRRWNPLYDNTRHPFCPYCQSGPFRNSSILRTRCSGKSDTRLFIALFFNILLIVKKYYEVCRYKGVLLEWINKVYDFIVSTKSAVKTISLVVNNKNEW